MKIKADYSNAPQWKELTVKATLPEQLKCLDEIAHNMWWVWNYEARDLFRDLDPELYHDVKHNPVMLLERLSFTRKEEILKDKALMKRVKNVCDLFHQYMDVKPDSKRPSVAYFCMEYGIHSALKIYSGGLGMLAGDYVKEASDSNVDMCAVGFRVKLYLLDTDNEMNSDFDKPITHALYGGDWENRLKQEILLGIGGMLLLKKLGIKKDIYHCNEGHAALCNLQRLCDYIEEDGLTFNQAMELVRASSLYTVHTPVPAGHDYFDEGLFGKYMGGYPQKNSACQPLPATPARRSMVCRCCTDGYRRRCLPPSGTATIPRRTTWATSPTAYTSPPGALPSGDSSMPSTSMQST